MIWTTQDGRRIPMSKMSFTHLYNATRMVLNAAAEQIREIGDMSDTGDLIQGSPTLFDNEKISLHDFLSPAAIGLVKEYRKRVGKARLTARQRKALRIDDEVIMKMDLE